MSFVSHVQEPKLLIPEETIQDLRTKFDELKRQEEESHWLEQALMEIHAAQLDTIFQRIKNLDQKNTATEATFTEITNTLNSLCRAVTEKAQIIREGYKELQLLVAAVNSQTHAMHNELATRLKNLEHAIARDLDYTPHERLLP